MIIRGYKIAASNKNKVRFTKLQKLKFVACDEIEPLELDGGEYFISEELYLENKQVIDDALIAKGQENIITWLANNVQDVDNWIVTAIP